MPSAGQSLGIYRRMHSTRLRRGRLRWAAIALLLLPVAATGAVVSFARDLFDPVMGLFFLFLLPFLPALGASAMVSEEIENKTFTFIFARPAPRWTMVMGKYVALVVPMTIGCVISVIGVYLLASVRGTGEDFTNGLPHLGRVIGATIIGTLVYGAMASVIGSWFTRHPFVAVILYFLLVEALLGSTPVIVNLLSMSWHLKNLAGLPLPETSFFASELNVPLWVSTLVLTGVGLLALLGAALGVTGTEYRTDR
jgi:ABC-type transport system involved in multi-copper enzyme maturation permease subunit